VFPNRGLIPRSYLCRSLVCLAVCAPVVLPALGEPRAAVATSVPTIDDVCAGLRKSGHEQPCTPDLVVRYPIRFNLFDCSAAVASVSIGFDEVPGLPMVFVQVEGEWLDVIRGDSITEAWESAVIRIVQQEKARIIAHPDLAARDFSRLFVDSGPVVVLESEASIPSPTSDAEGKPQSSRPSRSPREKDRIRTAQALATIHPPRIMGARSATCWQFYTWAQFDGVVEEWRIVLNPKVDVKVRTIATGVGAWTPRGGW